MRASISGGLKLALLSGLLWVGAGTTVAQAQTLPVQSSEVPGEGLDGTLLPPSTYAPDHPLIRLDADEVQGLSKEKSTFAVGAVSGEALPPIMVSVSSGYYEQVAVTVPAEAPAAASSDHRRRSLASRGGHKSPETATVSSSRTVYRSVYRSSARQLDISPIINKYAEKYQLDPWMLRGVIEVESAFRPQACSPVGAGGLMQLMPGTASYLGCRDRFDPDQNIEAGARYLRMMLDRFNGDANLAIAAYNAGPGNVSRYGGIPPFAETQNYVRKVTEAWHWRPGK